MYCLFEQRIILQTDIFARGRGHIRKNFLPLSLHFCLMDILPGSFVKELLAIEIFI